MQHTAPPLELTYPRYALAVAMAFAIPYMLPSYYPDTESLILDNNYIIPTKTYTSYTSRLLKMISTTGISRNALDYINDLQVQINRKLCSAVVHVLKDSRMVTVRDSHVMKAVYALIRHPELKELQARLAFVKQQIASDNDFTVKTIVVDNMPLVFPPSRFRTTLLNMTDGAAWRISVTSTILSTAVVQILSVLIIRASVAQCNAAKKKRITEDHVYEALRGDDMKVVTDLLVLAPRKQGPVVAPLPNKPYM